MRTVNANLTNSIALSHPKGQDFPGLAPGSLLWTVCRCKSKGEDMLLIHYWNGKEGRHKELLRLGCPQSTVLELRRTSH